MEKLRLASVKSGLIYLRIVCCLAPAPSSLYFCENFDDPSLMKGVYISLVNVVVGNYGFVGNSAYLNGLDAYMEIPLFNNNPLSQFTFCIWVKRTDAGSGLQGILYNGDCMQSASIEISSQSSTTTGAGIVTQYTDGHQAFTGVPVGSSKML